MKQITAILNKETLFTIKWRITDWCNYRCSYCLRMHTVQDVKPNEEELCSIAKDINTYMIPQIRTGIKMNLIGGELSFLDLPKILDNITSDKLKRVHLTTNFSNKLDYYINLYQYLKNRGTDLSMNVSYHHEYNDTEVFVKKVAELKKTCNLYALKIEYVISKETADGIDLFKSLCEKYDLDYLLEVDKTETAEFKQKYVQDSKVTLKRYTIKFDDGSEDNTMTRNQLINVHNNQFVDKVIIRNKEQRNLFKSEGFVCTAGYTYAYIKYNKVAINSSCISGKEYKPIKDFIVRTRPEPCHQGYCNLCGDISLWK